ncbi:MAG TPA: FHA domain-containing protein [Acidimicrobiales bacterium]|nr:FHA domain-containing protein [Acidimicrobiales bacterium]
MPESLLRILQFLLLLLVYLFFLRVLRAVWAEVANPRELSPAGPPRGGGGPTSSPTMVGRRERPGPAPKGTPTRLKVVEPANRKGQAFDLAEELTVGRAAGCQVKVDDTYASQLHARVFQRDGQLFVEDLGSTNGTYLNRRGTQAKEKVAGPLALKIGDRLMIGKTVLEVAK